MHVVLRHALCDARCCAGGPSEEEEAGREAVEAVHEEEVVTAGRREAGTVGLAHVSGGGERKPKRVSEVSGRRVVNRERGRVGVRAMGRVR